jgi:hypothetical protein
MALLHPVSGDVNPAEMNRRNVPPKMKMIANQDPKRFPPVYIFNVGPRRHEFPPNDRGARYLEACPKGELVSKPLIFRCIESEIYDLADGAGNMAWHDEEGLDKAKALIGCGEALSLYTKNLEWFGVFISENAKPSDDEIETALGKWHQMAKLIYETGSDKVSQNIPVDQIDRAIYNEAAAVLGKESLFGSTAHTMATCPICFNKIMQGARKCTHCNEALTPENIAKFTKK